MSIVKQYKCDFKECGKIIEEDCGDLRAVRIARMNPWTGYYIFHACDDCFASLESHLDMILYRTTKEEV